MSGTINTANALLKAGNYESARRIANDLIDQNPQNVSAWHILIEIEEKTGNYKQTLDLIEQVLEQHPDNFKVRQAEILLYLQNGKKRRARIGIERFKSDFPSSTNSHDMLELAYENNFGSSLSAAKKLRHTAFAGDNLSKGIFDSNSGALFSGQKFLLKALEENPTNHTANRHLAFNQLLLSKPWSAWKAADNVLANEPNNTDMRILKKLCWCFLYPPIYYYHILITVFWLARRWLPDWLLIIAIIPLLGVIFLPLNWFEANIKQLLNFSYFGWVSGAFIMAYFLSYSLFNSKVQKWIFASLGKVRLKDY